MPVIATIVSGLLFWACYWFFYLDGHKKVEAAFASRRDTKRRVAAIEAQARAPIKSIKDPREAGTVLLFLIARQKGDYSAAQLAAIEQEMRGVMAIAGDLAPYLSHARWACTQSPGVTAAIQDLAPLFNERLTEAERDDLFAMVERIANVDGPPNEDQTAALEALRKRLSAPEATGQGFGFTKPR
ncbi:TerB family tellurite resistance protein [Methylopila sp. M107]|uniref:tellurite resistance TerB family protein n=1 Tax=Methylopila sp. M107 TaxID=1101190 RepID=UPI00037AE26C|nr:TerB family tellurite resistance protein [Methylopila sp. M107]